MSVVKFRILYDKKQTFDVREGRRTEQKKGNGDKNHIQFNSPKIFLWATEGQGPSWFLNNLS